MKSRETQPEQAGRRAFLNQVAGAGAAALAGVPVLVPGTASALTATAGLAAGGDGRRREAVRVRERAAQHCLQLPPATHPDNGDEARYSNRAASFSKCLPHDERGDVDPAAYERYLRALRSGIPGDFEAIPMGGPVKLVNPRVAFAFELEGCDSHEFSLPPAPAFASAWQGAEMAELYWQALTRNVPFADYGVNTLIAEAAADLSTFPEFRGPREGGAVTPGTLFRGDTPGDLVGPYLSQFLWKNVPFGATTVIQRYRTTVPGRDYMRTFADCLACQRGHPPVGGDAFDPIPRYLRNARDLGEWDHHDFSYQGFLAAALILLSFGPAALDEANPYLASSTQSGFASFGPPHVLDLVARVASAALRAAWYQKWLVHRRVRPEAFGARVHNHITGASPSRIHAQLLESPALSKLFSTQGTYLLPMAYPEGCPTHPAYPAGHATIAGACVTVLKAFFKESFVIPSPVVASADGTALLPYSGPDLTVGRELSKLAANVALGRNAAGVHWRTDATEGLKLGEAVALAILRDLGTTHVEQFSGLSLTRFDGTSTRV
jgi:hypothetical protein